MDIELLRTFLEVGRVRHFGKAAAGLCVTQAAVSARIRSLEEALGVSLFVRSRNNIHLTPAGLRLKEHAETVCNAWVRALQQTALQPDFSAGLAIGATWDLWDILLNDWLVSVRQRMPDIALQVEASSADALIRKLIDGVLDVAFVFEPPRVADLEIEQVAGIRLVLLSTQRGQTVMEALGMGYIMVDWGTGFSQRHARFFPDLPGVPLRMSPGTLAMRHLLCEQGSAYLAEQVLSMPDGKDRFFKVEDAPVIERKAYAVYRPDPDREAVIHDALALLKRLPPDKILQPQAGR